MPAPAEAAGAGTARASEPVGVRAMRREFVKFTSEGGTIDVAVEPAAAQVVMRIRDNGRGIAADHLPHVFDLFHKGDGESGGLGIGLAVVKGLTEMHGGSVEVRSDGVGHGSEFVVTLPAIAGEPAA